MKACAVDPDRTSYSKSWSQRELGLSREVWRRVKEDVKDCVGRHFIGCPIDTDSDWTTVGLTVGWY